MYSQLPTEIKLNILSQTSPSAYNSISQADLESNDLMHHIVHAKLHHYLNNQDLTISLFSSNNKESNIKNFYHTQFEISPQYTTFKIAKLHHKENLFSKTSSDSTKPSFSLEQLNHLDLILNEDQSTTKISFNLLLASKIISETSFKLNKSQTASSKTLNNDTFKFNYELIQGEKEPEKGGYDYEINYNHSLNFTEFKIDNTELLKILEDEECMIVRY